jgi:hypothetical protein
MERESKSREGSAVKYNPYKGRRRTFTDLKTDLNILTSTKTSNASLVSKRKSAKSRKSQRSRSKKGSRREIPLNRSVGKSKDRQKLKQRKKNLQIKSPALLYQKKTEGKSFFSSLNGIMSGSLIFKRKSSLDINKLAEEKIQIQNEINRKKQNFGNHHFNSRKPSRNEQKKIHCW